MSVAKVSKWSGVTAEREMPSVVRHLGNASDEAASAEATERSEVIRESRDWSETTSAL